MSDEPVKDEDRATTCCFCGRDIMPATTYMVRVVTQRQLPYEHPSHQNACCLPCSMIDVHILRGARSADAESLAKTMSAMAWVLLERL